jgi:methionyl-tRNA synthetase
VKDLAILLEPYVPNTSASMFRQLGVEAKKWDDLGKLSLVSGAPIGNPEILFKKLEPKETAALKLKFDGRQAPAQKQARFSDFDLEVGEIIDIQKHPSADKLYVEKVRLGDGIRQLVSGLVKYYAPGQLLGKKVVILRNIKPATLRGVESQGMLLAAENKEGLVEVLSPEKSQVGEKITLTGEAAKPLPEITVDDFFSVPIKVEKQNAVAEGKALATRSEEIKTKDVIDGKVG